MNVASRKLCFKASAWAALNSRCIRPSGLVGAANSGARNSAARSIDSIVFATMCRDSSVEIDRVVCAPPIHRE
jgi:hypothetical protein